MSTLHPQKGYSVSLPAYLPASLHLSVSTQRYRNINLFSIRLRSSAYAQVPTPPGRTNLPLETLDFRPEGFSPSFSLLIPAFSLLIPPASLSGHLLQPTERSPTKRAQHASAASVHVLAPLYLRRRYSRPVSYYALFQGMAASKPTSWLSVNIHLLSHLDMIWDLSRRSGLFPSRPRTLSSVDSLPVNNIRYSQFA